MRWPSPKIIQASVLVLKYLFKYFLEGGLHVLTTIGNFCIFSIAIGIIIEIIVMYPIQYHHYLPRINNLLVLLISWIPIAMPT